MSDSGRIDFDYSNPFIAEGVDDRYEGSERADCPYSEGTDGQSGWLFGWEMTDRVLKGVQ